MLEKIVITLMKASNTAGTCSFLFKGPDDEDLIILNQIQINLNDGANPISCMKKSGVPLIQGTLVEDAQEYILDIFQKNVDKGPGIYKFVIDLCGEEQ